MATLPVKYFTSSMQGAPQLTNAWGDLTTLLDACLVSGFNVRAISSLTMTGGIATVTIATGHLYQVDQVIAISGADQAEYNGEFRVLSATSNDLTFAITGTPASPATGASITVKVAPLNFDIAFTGTNKRVYRSKNVASNRPYLRVDSSLDPAYTTTYAKKAKVTMAEAMLDVDTFVSGSGRAPYDTTAPGKNEIGSGSGVSAVDGWHKWYYAAGPENAFNETSAPAAFNRSWVLIGDDRGFYLLNDTNGSYGKVGYSFTDFESFRAGDGFNTILTATDRYMAANGTTPFIDTNTAFTRSLDFSGKVLMRDHLQIGGNIRVGFVSLGTLNGQTISGYSTGVPWPNGPDYSLVLHPVYLKQENNHLRGKLPGMMWVHNDSPLSDLVVVDNVVGYPGRKFLIVAGTNLINGAVARVAFDITGPWW